MSRVTTKAGGGISAPALPRDLAMIVVIVTLPDADKCINPPPLPAPDGTTYRWVALTVMGTPALDRLTQALGDGWAFVFPSAHPDMPTMSLGETIEKEGFALLEKSTAMVQEQRAHERAGHMDMDIRAIGILERYEGESQIVGPLRVSVINRLSDGTTAAPLHTLDEVRAELLKRFASADVRLFMRRRFGV